MDEVEAINSIYGENSLVPAAGEGSETYILSLPDEETNVSLRLQFPVDYPNVPPSVISTNSAAGGRRGVAARDLDMFRRALGNVYQPGQVCLFDAIEELKRLQEEEVKDSQSLPLLEDAAGDEEEGRQAAAAAAAMATATAEKRLDHTSVLDLGPEPPWILSDPVTEMRSTFLARCTAVNSPDQAAQYVQHLLESDKRVRSATHNITAWRIRGPNGTSFQDCDDDGETAAGGRLLHLMQLMDLWDSMVVVTRWYGGQKLGPRRFALINAAARDSFVKAGLVDETPTAKKKGHGK